MPGPTDERRGTSTSEHLGERSDGRLDERSSGRPKLTRKDTWKLVFATYRTSFPYLLIFIIAMLAATWFITIVLFR